MSFFSLCLCVCVPAEVQVPGWGDAPLGAQSSTSGSGEKCRDASHERQEPRCHGGHPWLHTPHTHLPCQGRMEHRCDLSQQTMSFRCCVSPTELVIVLSGDGARGTYKCQISLARADGNQIFRRSGAEVEFEEGGQLTPLRLWSDLSDCEYIQMHSSGFHSENGVSGSHLSGEERIIMRLAAAVLGRIQMETTFWKRKSPGLSWSYLKGWNSERVDVGDTGSAGMRPRRFGWHQDEHEPGRPSLESIKTL